MKWFTEVDSIENYNRQLPKIKIAVKCKCLLDCKKCKNKRCPHRTEILVKENSL